MPDARAEFALLALAVMWGTSHVVTKNILMAHTPFFYTSLRFGLAAVLFGAVFFRSLRHSQGRELRQGLLLGLCSFTGISLYTAGLVFTQASKAGFISGLYLVFTPLLAWGFFRMRPTRDNLLGLLIAITGFGLLSYPQSDASFNWGDGLILCAAVAWGRTLPRPVRLPAKVMCGRWRHGKSSSLRSWRFWRTLPCASLRLCLQQEELHGRGC